MFEVATGQADDETTRFLRETLDSLGAQDGWSLLVPVLQAIADGQDRPDLSGLDSIDTAIATEALQGIRTYG